MRGLCILLAMCICCSHTQGETATACELINLKIMTTLVPSPASVDVLLPPGYDELTEPVPLMVWLHGGTSGKDYLERRLRSYVEQAWAAGDLVPCVIVAPVTGDSFYIDWHDGTNQWDTFITGQMLSEVRERFHVKQDRAGTVIAGSSFGGQGVLRIAFRHPEMFIAAASMAPGFPPVLKLEDWDISYFSDEVLANNERRFGEPIDRAFWRATHPPTMVIDNATKLRESGLQLLIEVGDEDANGNFRSVELLHRLLFDAAIPHDYHLHRGAGHVGRSKEWRTPEVFRFLSRALTPEDEPDSDAELHKQKAIRAGRYRPRKTNELPRTLIEFDKP